MSKEIWVVPFFGQGHLLPSIELCKQIASRNFKTLLVIPSNLSSSVPAALRHFPLVGIIEIPSGQEEPGHGPLPPPGRHHQDLATGLENTLKAQLLGPNGIRPICAVLDVMMDWTGEIFEKLEVPTVGFFTSGACSAAMEHAMWKAQPIDLGPGEVRLLPGLPAEMGLTYLDIKQQHQHGPPGPPPGPFRGTGPQGMGPPKPGDQPPWLKAVKGFDAVMINTCDDLEHPFLEYLTSQIGKPVWGVGPLLPEQYWKSVGSAIHDHEIRSNRRSNIAEDEVIRWLDSKPHGSVLYISFGSEVGPSLEEYAQLADALETSNRPFIWVIQPGAGRSGPPGPQNPNRAEEGYFPRGLDTRVGPGGLILQGWAPQLLILSHSSTGGFLSHCGWNSTTEAIGRAVPLLAWPIRGDQHHNAKLVVAHLKVGFMVCDDLSKIKKEDIVKGIERLMSDDEIKQRAEGLAARFGDGFPISSVAALDAFGDMINQRAA